MKPPTTGIKKLSSILNRLVISISIKDSTKATEKAAIKERAKENLPKKKAIKKQTTNIPKVPKVNVPKTDLSCFKILKNLAMGSPMAKKSMQVEAIFLGKNKMTVK